MRQSDARKLAKYHSFTKKELHEMLVEALDTFHDDYWVKPNNKNRIFDNGYYFNRCREWVDYTPDINDDDDTCSEIVTVRVLEAYGKFSKTQIPKKPKPDIKIMGSETPTI